MSWLYNIGSSTGLGGKNSGKSRGKSSLWNSDMDVPDGGLNDKLCCDVPFILLEYVASQVIFSSPVVYCMLLRILLLILSVCLFLLL